MTIPNDDDDMIGLAEAKTISGYSHEHLRRLCEKGKLPAKKITGNWVISRRIALQLKEKRRWARTGRGTGEVVAIAIFLSAQYER